MKEVNIELNDEQIKFLTNIDKDIKVAINKVIHAQQNETIRRDNAIERAKKEARMYGEDVKVDFSYEEDMYTDGNGAPCMLSTWVTPKGEIRQKVYYPFGK